MSWLRDLRPLEEGAGENRTRTHRSLLHAGLVQSFISEDLHVYG